LDIMSPLPEREVLRHNLTTLVEMVAEARDLDLLALGSTTFKREDLQKGDAIASDAGFSSTLPSRSPAASESLRSP